MTLLDLQILCLMHPNATISPNQILNSWTRIFYLLCVTETEVSFTHTMLHPLPELLSHLLAQHLRLDGQEAS